MTSPRSSSRSRFGWLFALLGALALTAWIGWLRAPSISMPMWNVDESIHAAVSRILLDGGLIYRDAIDQRTPLTYYLYAALFKFTGISLPATRVLLVLMLGATGGLLAGTVRRLHSLPTAVIAALAFAALTSWGLSKGDLYAAHTEWFAAFFSVLAAWLFWRQPNEPGRGWNGLLAGATLGLAVLCKQVALLELAPPLVTLLVLAITGEIGRASLGRRSGLVLGGWALIVGSVIALLILVGVGRDFLYYTWTYNVNIYGAEFTFREKLISTAPLIEHLVNEYPVLFACAVLGGIIAFVRATQKPGTDRSRPEGRGAATYLVTWLVITFGETAAGGRGYDHYIFVALPALSWAAALIPSWALESRQHPLARRWYMRLATLLLLGAVTYSVVIPPQRARQVEPFGDDPALRVSAFVNANSTPADKLFVWGYNPDIYQYADRTPASRFVYCSFLTGMIPWTNLEPGVDTSYAIVPGSMDDLIADLERHQPKFIIDCSVGPHRRFEKFPMLNYPQISDWIEHHYVEVESGIFVPQGFRLYQRHETLPAAVAATPFDHAGAHVGISGAGVISPGRKRLEIRADAPTAAITGLGLSINDQPPTVVDFAPTVVRQLQMPVEVGESDHTVELTLYPWIRFDDGPWQRAAPTTVAVETLSATPEQRTQFALPLVSTSVPAVGVRSIFGASAHDNPGQRNFSVHAPGILRYVLPAGATHLTGVFGIADGAFAPSNAAPTDGVEFIVRIVPPQESGRVLLQRLLQPREQPRDRGDQGFRCAIPADLPPDTVLELEVNNGPAGIASSDWSYWNELQLWTTP